MADRGAWFLGGYRKGMEGTLGESLTVASDNLGWTIRSLKYELSYNGFSGAMKLDLPSFGDAMDAQVKLAQRAAQTAPDGVVGPITGKWLLGKRIGRTAAMYGVPVASVDGIIRHESSYDIGAIGYVDQNDRGLTQQHINPTGVNLSQAIRPAVAVPRLCDHLDKFAAIWNEPVAIAAWNVGEGGASWWYSEGEPATGSPSWWNDGDLSARATAYVAAVLG